MNVDGYTATKYIECPRSDEIVAGRCGSGQISNVQMVQIIEFFAVN